VVPRCEIPRVGPCGFNRPDVEVHWTGAWWPAELRMWTQHDDDTWPGSDEYRDAEGKRSDTFPAEQIRKHTFDRSAGRT
jgi:hypothetical protein